MPHSTRSTACVRAQNSLERRREETELDNGELEDGRLRVTIEGRRNPFYLDGFEALTLPQKVELEALLAEELSQLPANFIGRLILDARWKPHAAKLISEP
jgi:hypothetical protein